MTFEIVVFLEDGREARSPVDRDEIVAGRQPDVDLPLDDEFLSRRHCIFKRRGERVSVADLGSYNGTYVNDLKIHEECFIEPGDVIRIGHSRVHLIVASARNELQIHTPDLEPTTGVAPVTKTRKAELSAAYSNLATVEAPKKRRASKAATPPPGNIFETLAGAPLGSLGPTERYERPSLGDEESETPTPIPSADFTASAVMRGSQSENPEDQERRGLRVIAQLARVMHTSEDVTEFLGFALSRVLEVVPAERGLIMRLDRKRKGLFVEAARSAVPNRSEREVGKMGVSHTIARRVIRDRVSVLVNDARIDDRFSGASSVQSLSVRSVLCTPIWRRDQVAGLLYLDHQLHSYAFSEADREFLVAVANLLALAMSHSKPQ